MSAAPSLALDKSPQRLFPRHPIRVPVDLIALRSGVPVNLPGRCTDISESGLGAVVAGELAEGQQVAVELRLPNVGVPVRARAVVRYQSRFHCGLEFSGLAIEQREMIRYWVYRLTLMQLDVEQDQKTVRQEAPASLAENRATPRRKNRLRISRRALYILLACALTLAVLAWWQWQRSWNELESHARTPTRASTGWGECVPKLRS